MAKLLSLQAFIRNKQSSLIDKRNNGMVNYILSFTCKSMKCELLVDKVGFGMSMLKSSNAQGNMKLSL